MSTRLDDRPSDLDTADPDRVAHYVVPKSAITAAIVTGTPVVAVCGYTFVPSRLPDSLPICSRCKQIYDAAPDHPIFD